MVLISVAMNDAIAPLIALGQLPSLTSPNNAAQPLPSGVERRGTLESTGVRLDGQQLFRIASPAVLNRSQPDSQIPVEVRARQIEGNLEQLVTGTGLPDKTVLDPKTLQVLIETINGHPVLLVKDATLVEPKVLLTVTDADAQYASSRKDRLAAQWQKILESELRQAVELRQPEALQQQVSTVINVLVAMVLLTLVLGATWAFFRQRKHHLEQRQAAESLLIHAQELEAQERQPIEPSDIGSGLQLLPRLRHHFSVQQRLQIVRFIRWLLFWAIAFTWIVGIAYSLNTFPQTRQFAKKVVAIPIVLLLTWFLTGLTNRLTDLIVDRFIESREQEQFLTAANLQRIATIANVIKGLKVVLLYAIAILSVLQWLNLIPGLILTLGALVALAISFAAQSLVKDLVNGFLILLEDQFRIGDNIVVGDVLGTVENLNLRVTQIRSDNGNLITVPNSLIATVENRTRTWARADFRIEVAYNTNVDHALAVVRETVDRMAQDPQWQSVILDTHELFGVDQISHAGIVIRIWIKTVPSQQWAIARELRRRLKIAFDLHHIQIGIPQQIRVENGSVNLDAVEHSSNSD
ncbi:MAG: mechanosensitive ion channel protein MscS [Leptolyngbya sp.]|nr:MAG: mechanosensitive ion channel protein MscS [Leptolyngbya sp.]